MTRKILDKLYCIEISLPNNPLKYLNAYVFTGDRNLLIDTGFNLRLCLDELKEGLSSLSVKPENTDVFLSHAHSDHTGNAKALQDLGYRIIMGREDFEVLNTDKWSELKERALSEGTPVSVLEDIIRTNPAVNYRSAPFDADFVTEDEILNYGNHNLRVIHTPGHTAGQLCLYDENVGLFYTADHILFDITPNINSLGAVTDALGTYLDSLLKVRDIETSIILPAHRTTGGKTLRERVDELLLHHEKRLDEMLSIVRKFDGISAYDIAGRTSWNIRSRSWDDFPSSQKWFAIGETLAHLEYLEKRRIITRHILNSGCVYSA